MAEVIGLKREKKVGNPVVLHVTGPDTRAEQ
jgi:hypothetical protein